MARGGTETCGTADMCLRVVFLLLSSLKMLKNEEMTRQGQVVQLCIHGPELPFAEQLNRVGQEGKGKLRNISGNAAYVYLAVQNLSSFSES